MTALLNRIALAVAALAVALGSLLPGTLRRLPWYQPALTHVVVYAAVAFLAVVALRRSRRAMAFAVLSVLGFGVLMEVLQAFVPVRQGRLDDVAMNALGTLVGAAAAVGLVAAVRAWRRRPVPGGHADAPLLQRPDAAGQIRDLADHRLLPAGELLHRRGLIDEPLAALARQWLDRVGSPGNLPAADARVLGAMHAAGVRCLVMKGTLLAHTVYPDQRQRTRGDTDLLVAGAERDAAERVLQELGFARAYRITAKTSNTQDQWLGGHEGAAVVIDLHWRVLNHPAFADVFDFEALWTRRCAFAIDGTRAWGLAPADALLHACLHYFAHHGEEFRPAQWLLDMDLLWRAMDAAERAVLAERARASGTAGIVAAAMGRAQQLLDTPIEDDELDVLREAGRFEWRSGLLRTDGRPVRGLAFRLRALPSWSARLAFLRRLLAPASDYMRAKYPEGSRMGLMGLYWRRIREGWKNRRSP